MKSLMLIAGILQEMYSPHHVVSLLVDLETARQERSVLLSDEPKTTGERKEKGVCIEKQIGFYEI
jgi:hypothetical protein